MISRIAAVRPKKHRTPYFFFSLHRRLIKISRLFITSAVLHWRKLDRYSMLALRRRLLPAGNDRQRTKGALLPHVFPIPPRHRSRQAVTRRKLRWAEERRLENTGEEFYPRSATRTTAVPERILPSVMALLPTPLATVAMLLVLVATIEVPDDAE